MNNPISTEEVRELCKNLKRKKAPGWDCVTSEHIQYGGNYLIKCLTWLFNKIIEYEYIPPHFKRGIIIPIPKGSKDKSSQENYRGITLIPVIGKMYEKCIMNRVEMSNQVKDKIDKLQGVVKRNCSSLHTAWLLKEAISCKMEQGETVYVGLLDIKKPMILSGKKGYFTSCLKLGSMEKLGD
jgi:hypothetical protein